MKRAARLAVPITSTVLTAVLLAGCGGDADPAAAPEHTEATAEPTPGAASTPPSPTGPVPLPDGYLAPGRYRFVVSVDCKGIKHDPIACPAGVPDPPPIPLDLTVPAGWEHPVGLPVVWPTSGQDQEGALVIGWTSNVVRVQSDPCASRSHELPDIEVGPGVDDFVDTVVAQDWYRGSSPVGTRVGGASGRYFTFTGPARLGGCFEWRPWDPGFYAQGPRNIWEVWALDVGGHRVVVVVQYFPGSSRTTVTQLHRMVESIEFRGAG